MAVSMNSLVTRLLWSNQELTASFQLTGLTRAGLTDRKKFCPTWKRLTFLITSRRTVHWSAHLWAMVASWKMNKWFAFLKNDSQSRHQLKFLKDYFKCWAIEPQTKILRIFLLHSSLICNKLQGMLCPKVIMILCYKKKFTRHFSIKIIRLLLPTFQIVKILNTSLSQVSCSMSEAGGKEAAPPLSCPLARFARSSLWSRTISTLLPSEMPWSIKLPRQFAPIPLKSETIN